MYFTKYSKIIHSLAIGLSVLITFCMDLSAAAKISELKLNYGFSKGALTAEDLKLKPNEALSYPLFSDATEKNKNNPHSFHLKWTLFSIQGMANRKEPLLWMGKENVWKNYCVEKYKIHFIDNSMDSVDELFKKFLPHFNGLIVYDESQSDLAILAFNLANQNFCVPVSSRLYEEYSTAFQGIRVVGRLEAGNWSREEIYGWMIDKILPVSDPESAFSIFQGFPDNPIGLKNENSWESCGDIPFRFKSFIFNLSGIPQKNTHNYGDPLQFRLFTQIMKRLKPPAMVFGWNSAEAVYSTFGHMMGHSMNADNTSFLASVKLQSTFPYKQNRKPKFEKPEEKLYVAFVSNEGDTLRLFYHGFWGAWQKPERGSAPMNWAICPGYVKYFPLLFEYYYSTKTENDYFCYAPNGVGYVHTDLMSQQHVDMVLKETERISRDYLDLHEMIVWASNNRDTWDKIAALPSIQAIFPKPNSLSDSGRLFHIKTGEKTVPVLRESYGHYWITRTPAYNSNKETQLTPERFAKELMEKYEKLPKPAFLILYSLEGEGPGIIQKVSQLVDPSKVVLTNLATMSHLLKQVPSDVDQTPSEPSDEVETLVSPNLLLLEGESINGAHLANGENELTLEIARSSWGGVEFKNLKFPPETKSLHIKVKELTGGNWEPRISGLRLDVRDPDKVDYIVGIQPTSMIDGPYPNGEYHWDFDPRILAKIKRGETIPFLQIVIQGGEVGDRLTLSKIEIH